MKPRVAMHAAAEAAPSIMLDHLRIALAQFEEPPACGGLREGDEPVPTCREFRELRRATATYASGRYRDALQQ